MRLIRRGTARGWLRQTSFKLGPTSRWPLASTNSKGPWTLSSRSGAAEGLLPRWAARPTQSKGWSLRIAGGGGTGQASWSAARQPGASKGQANSKKTWAKRLRPRGLVGRRKGAGMGDGGTAWARELGGRHFRVVL